MNEHPAVIQSKERLANYNRRTPPGYPLGYNLHHHKFCCAGCGSQITFATLTTVDRAGSHSKSYHPTSPREKIYDLPVDTVTSDYVTPRCEKCIDRLPKEPVPALPDYKEIIGHRQKAETLDFDDFKDLSL